jgi:hypothetical protein
MHQFTPFCIEVHGVTKRSEMPQNMSLGSNHVDRIHLLQIIPMRHCCTNLCISDLVQPNLHQSLCCKKTVQNTIIHEFGVRWGGSRTFVVKNLEVTSLHEIVH